MNLSEYSFELIILLAEQESPDVYLDALYEAGCDDATISTGESGMMGLSFIREDSDAMSAIETALADIKQAIPHARLVRAEPYLQNLSELAYEFGFTKQNLQKYARGKAAMTSTTFPRPYLEGKISYWSVYDVAQWFEKEGIREIDEQRMEVLLLMVILNLEIQKQHQPKAPVATRKKIAKLLKHVA